MDIIILLIGSIAMFCGGGLIGSRTMELRCERIRREDHKLAQKLIDEQYKQGYDDGFAKGVIYGQEKM